MHGLSRALQWLTRREHALPMASGGTATNGVAARNARSSDPSFRQAAPLDGATIAASILARLLRGFLLHGLLLAATARLGSPEGRPAKLQGRPSERLLARIRVTGRDLGRIVNGPMHDEMHEI